MARTRAPAGGGRAVVIGASMAGLAVAKALTEAFDQVTVIDRDRIPDGTGQRAGVPQGRHLHVLLAAGGDALEELFPGLLGQMVADGAALADLGERGCVIVNGHRLAQAALGRGDVLASRPFVEGHVRRRVLADPAITIVQGCEVRAMVTDPDRRRVVGVEVAARPGEAPSEIVTADLVVDCSGRRSSTPRWLAALGYAPPAVDALRVEVRYATRRYRLPRGTLRGDVFLLVAPTPDRPRGGAATLTEGGQWIVTVFGMGGERPPLDPQGFEAFADTLAAPDLHEVVCQGHPIDDPVGFRYPANVRRRYERLRDLPDGLLVAGDAVCSFNPIYGQGMSVAALEATTLRRQVQRVGPLSPRAWFRSIAPIVDAPWDLAVGGDLAVRAIEGRRRLQVRLANRYMEHFYRAAVHDPALSVLFGRVSGLLDPASRLTRPAAVARVVRGNLRRADQAGGDGRVRRSAEDARRRSRSPKEREAS